MHELTQVLIAGTAPSLRQEIISSKAAASLRLGPDVFEIDGHSFAVADVFDKVDQAFSEGTAPLTDMRGTIATLQLHRPTQELAIVIASQATIVEGLGLASRLREVREAALERLFEKAWLGSRQVTFRKRAVARAVTPKELNEIHEALESTVEAHLARLSRVLQANTAKFGDLECCDFEGLQLLVGDAQEAKGADAIADSLQVRRKARLRDDPKRALPLSLSVSISPAWPIKPAPREISNKDLVDSACPTGQLGDPFAALAALDLAHRTGGRLHEAAADITSIIEASAQLLEDTFSVYAGCVVVAFGSLTENPQTRRTPALWRRVAAYSLAGIHTAHLGSLGTDLSGEFFRGARGSYGLIYDVASARSAYETPRWHPQLGTPDALRGLWWRRLSLLANAAPAKLKPRLQTLAERTLDVIQKSTAPLSLFFPGPLDGFRHDDSYPPLAELATESGVVGVSTEGRAVQWRGLVHGSLISPPTEAMASRVGELVQQTTVREMIDEEGDIPPDITAAAYVIATLKRADLAKVLAAKLAAAATSEASVWPMTQASQALLVLAAAEDDEDAFRASVRDYFQSLAFGANRKEAAEALAGVIDLLIRMDPTLRAPLSRSRVAVKSFQSIA